MVQLLFRSFAAVVCSDNFYTVAYWYQQGPHRLRKPLPPVDQRIPAMVNVGGPTVGKP